jgi:N6-adenosine-specific RNA methylase IME4
MKRIKAKVTRKVAAKKARVRNEASAPAKAKKAPAQKGAHARLDATKAFSPYIQATRWPRDISLDLVVKRRDMGDITGLAKSIDDRNCLLQPVVIYHDDGTDYLVAGQRRLAAWPLSKFRKEPIPVHLVDVDSIVAGEWDENAKRKDFTPSESVEMMQALLPVAKAAAKARQAHGRTAPGKRAAPAEQDVDAGNAEDHLARYLGRDRKTLNKALEVVEAAEKDPEKFGPLLEAMDKTGKVNGPWRRLQIHNQVADIDKKKKSGKLDLPEGKFDRAVIDYPWPHEPGNETEGRATRPYSTMPIAEGCALMAQVGKRLAKDATVYFWTTSFHMQYAYTLLRAMGLTVAGDAARAADDPCKGAVNAPIIITWVKDTLGQGQRLREKTEHCIVAIKGNPVWSLTAQTTELRGASGENSEKPASFYQLIDEITPAQRSLEMFARRELPPDWVGWGDQVGLLNAGPQPPPFVDFGNINDGLLAVLGAIERGEPISFNENDHVVRGLFTGKTARKLTKAGRAKLAEVRAEQVRREDCLLTDEQKAANARERLRKRGDELGHQIIMTIDSTSDAPKIHAHCAGCDAWAIESPWSDEWEAGAQEAFDAHLRQVAAVALRPEAEAKTARRGSRRAKRLPADEAAADVEERRARVDAARAKLHAKFPDGVHGHVITMSNGDVDGVHCSIATCQCGWSNVVPWGGDHYAAQDEAAGVHWSAVADFAEAPAAPAEAAE